MNLQHALECITNSTAINKLDANILLNNNITSNDDIHWSKFSKLNIYGEHDSDGNNHYIDEISEFNGDLTLDAVNINSLEGNLKSLKINTSDISVVNFEASTKIEELNFHTACLDRTGSSPSIINAIIKDDFQELIDQTVNLEGFLSKAANISRNASRDTTEHFMSLGYLTIDNNRNENWANVSIENQTSGISNRKYIVPTGFYNNLVFYATEDLNSNFILDYINNAEINDDENYHDIVIPHAGALKAYLPDEVPELPIVLGDYCFGGIGSKPESKKDRHLYLTFDDTFIFNTDLDSPPRDDGATVEIKESSRPFTENTFLARPGAIQQIHINLEKMRPETDKDPLNLYFSDFFTTVEKTINTEGTEDPVYNFTIKQDDFNSYIEKLEGMVGGSENVIFNSPYQEIDAIIEA